MGVSWRPTLSRSEPERDTSGGGVRQSVGLGIATHASRRATALPSLACLHAAERSAGDRLRFDRDPVGLSARRGRMR